MTPRNNTPKTEPGDIEPGSCWVGGRRIAPIYLSDEGAPFRPHVVLWLDVVREALVATQVVYPDDPKNVAIECLRRAMERPLSGAPRRPAVIRVEEADVAEAIRREFPEIDVQVGPTPELEPMMRHVGESMQRNPDPPSYFEDGRVSEVAVRGFFQAAAALYKAAPWQSIHDDCLLSVSIPALGLHNACVSIIGELGESCGFLLFERIADYRRFVMDADIELGTELKSEDESAPAGAPLFSVTYERGSELHKALRREIARYKWEVAAPQAYPMVMRLDPDNVCRPLGENDYLQAELCAQALTRFCEKHRPLFAEVEPLPTSEAYQAQAVSQKEPYLVEVTVPHPEAHLVFEDDTEEESYIALYRDFIERRDEATEWQTWVDDFIDTLRAEPRAELYDDAYCDVAAFACNNLLNWKCYELDGLPNKWTPAQVQFYLLEYFPETVSGDSAALEVVPDVLRSFFTWLSQQGHISARTATDVKQRIGRIRGDFSRLTRTAPGDLVQLGKPRKT
jgi:hypothetical protein